jgi:hypothetical protein
MNQIKRKMSDLQVVHRALDFWDPMFADFFFGQFDEYDSYGPPLLQMLRSQANEIEIAEKLHEIRFKKMDARRTDVFEAKNRFYAWAILQIWKRQQAPTSNIRIVDSLIKHEMQGRRMIGDLELIQRRLEDWDPLELTKEWLCGADTLNIYDEYASRILNAIRAEVSTHDICIILEEAATSESDQISFCFDHPKLKGENLERSFAEEISKRASRNKDLASSIVSMVKSATLLYRRTE